MGSGGGETSTTTVDPVYNAGMLQLSQEQQGWAREMFNMFKYGVTYDPNEQVTVDSTGNIVETPSRKGGQGLRSSSARRAWTMGPSPKRVAARPL